MRMHGGICASTLLVALIVTGCQAAKPEIQIGNDHGVLEWIRNAPGGYVHPDQEFRVDPATGTAGMYATKLIPKGEILLQVPWSIVLKSDDPQEEGQMCCGTVKSVAREMKKGNSSEFAAYANYLNAQEAYVPSAWSQKGQELIQALVGGTVTSPDIPPAEPTEWLTTDWYRRCRGSRADTVAAKAALMVLQRSDDAFMIPGMLLSGLAGIVSSVKCFCLSFAQPESIHLLVAFVFKRL